MQKPVDVHKARRGRGLGSQDEVLIAHDDDKSEHLSRVVEVATQGGARKAHLSFGLGHVLDNATGYLDVAICDEHGLAAVELGVQGEDAGRPDKHVVNVALAPERDVVRDVPADRQLVKELRHEQFADAAYGPGPVPFSGAAQNGA